MAKDNNKPEIRKPKFNNFWIYIPIILIFIGLQIFGGSTLSAPEKTTQVDFQKMLREGDVEKIEIINKKVAKVYLTEAAFQNEEHTNKFKGKLLKPTPKDPVYQFEFGDLQNFENSTNQIIKDNGLTTKIGWTTESNIWAEFLPSILFFAIIIGVWIYIMRRMSSGAGGGAGGQIFNIGKSRAKLFDEKTDVKTTFKDVAGLEGAKEEVQ
ncbi:MAG: ATP-dependent metallopeptidase FtsH/Yme1/Tma family protein, partial [Flavobacteriaceae bacterium]|nr:ATP-dependent metallopeptidase FtsH/Yme1/Tma family protein [Flavobacteriaceae bacterium]